MDQIEPELSHLLDAVQTISPHGEVRFHLSKDEHKCRIEIVVGDVVLVSTQEGSVSEVLREALSKVEKMSQRMMNALDPDDPPTGSR